MWRFVKLYFLVSPLGMVKITLTKIKRQIKEDIKTTQIINSSQRLYENLKIVQFSHCDAIIVRMLNSDGTEIC